jgi:hypothetical protein
VLGTDFVTMEVADSVRLTPMFQLDSKSFPLNLLGSLRRSVCMLDWALIFLVLV